MAVFLLLISGALPDQTFRPLHGAVVGVLTGTPGGMMIGFSSKSKGFNKRYGAIGAFVTGLVFTAMIVIVLEMGKQV